MSVPSSFHMSNLNLSVIIRISLFFVFSSFIFGKNALGQNARITEEIKTIKTYPYSDQSPIPSVALSKKIFPFYPYSFFEGYTRESEDKDWTVVTLENDFIKVTVLPGVGGKVWGAIEKSTGRDFIYLNHVLKFRSIGIRGPWTSGGIEHNFGLDLGHAPWTASDVDYVLKEHPDGSVSCVVGGLDLASRTQWRVEIRLPGDKAYFETNSMWYNPTPLHDAYLSWENTAYHTGDDMQFYFPGTHYIGHGGKVSPWPIDQEGHNLNMYRENNFGKSKSYHVFGMYPSWFGAYFHDSEFGSGHWAPYDDAPGKKIWIWSLARDGAIWEDLLTDNDGQYIEAQSGVKLNQASPESGYNTPFNQLSMRPFYMETKSEVWFPVKEIGGMVDASKTGTLNLDIIKDSLQISFCPNIPIKDSLTVFMGKSLIYDAFIQLDPMQVYKKAIPLPEGGDQAIEVNIGRDLLHYTTDIKENKISRPLTTPAGQDFNSSEHLFRVADDMNSMRDYGAALETYLKCLEKEPTHSRALAKVAELYYRRGQYEKGMNYARKVLENNTYDGGANFIYGVIHKAMGNLTQAEEAFSFAVRTMEYRSAAYVQISGLHLQKKNYTKAREYAKKALDYNRYNITAYEFLVSAFRKLNKTDESRKTLETLLEIDPLNHFAHFEQYLLNPLPETLKTFTSAIRNELPFETYLELAIEYSNQGFAEEAIKVLEQSPESPTVNYWLAYLNRIKYPDKSQQYLRRAVEMSARMVFPFRLETIPVLSWAQEQNSSWKTTYYLGLIYWRILRTETAKELFMKCGDLPEYAPFYLARGVLFQKDISKIQSVDNDFKRANELDPKEWRTWHYLNDYLGATGSFQQELENSKKAITLFPDNPALGIDYAKALMNNDKLSESIKILTSIDVLPFEGAREGYDVYERANVSLAVNFLEKKKYKKVFKYLNDSKIYLENLGAGKPYDPDTRLQDYIAAYCETQLGNQKEANNYYQQIIDYSRKHWNNAGDPTNIYIATKVLNAHGASQEVKTAFKNWENEQNSLRDWRISAGSSSPKVQWVMAKYYKEEGRVKKLEAGIAENRPHSKFGILLRAINQIESK